MIVNRILRPARGLSTIALMRQLRILFQQSFLFRWMLANMAGWTVGLYLASWTLRSPVICLNGGLAAACIALPQWLVLRQAYNIPRQWIWFSIVGGSLGILPAFFLVITVLVGGLEVFALLSGMLFGTAVGGMQWFILRPCPRADWWLVANCIGCGIGGLLSVTTIISGLPLGLLLGAALFGLITGGVLQHILRQQE